MNVRADGRRTRKFFAKKSEAKAWAEQQQILLHNQGARTASILTDDILESAARAAKKLEPFGATLEDAAEFYAHHLRSQRRSCSVNELIQRLLGSTLRANRSERHLLDLRSRLNK